MWDVSIYILKLFSTPFLHEKAFYKKITHKPLTILSDGGESY